MEDAPSAMEILQELSHDMQVACNKQDNTASDRIYNRFLSQRETGAVSRYIHEHAPHVTGPRPPRDEDWTRPRPHPQARMFTIDGLRMCSFR
jgi:hypothetical protein